MFPGISLLLLWLFLSKSWVSSLFKLPGWGGSRAVPMGCPWGVAPSWGAGQGVTGRYFPGLLRIQLQSTHLALKPRVPMAFQGPGVTLPVLLPSNASLERASDSINPD